MVHCLENCDNFNNSILRQEVKNNDFEILWMQYTCLEIITTSENVPLQNLSNTMRLNSICF